MPSKALPTNRLADALIQIRRPVRPVQGGKYRLVGVRLYGAGARIQGEFDGSEIRTPVLNEIYPGDIIYNKMWASKGTFALVDEAIGKCFGTSEYPTFGPTNSNDPYFISMVLADPRLWKRAEAWSSGTTDRSRLGPRDFLLLPCILPSPTTQQVIGATTKSIADSIRGTEAVLKSLKLTKHAVMRELLTKGIRRDQASMQTLGKRWVLGRITEGVKTIPMDWELVRLTSVAKLESGHTPSRKVSEYWDGQIPWISLQDADRLGALTINSTRETFGPEGLANSSARLLPAGTVVLQRTANIGLCSIMAREMTTSQHFANWVCGPKIAPEYLLQVFRHMGREWKRLDAGSVLPDIYMPTFKKLQVLLPPLAEQQQIAKVGAAFDLRIEAEKRALAELQNTRKALAQELLSGRLLLPKNMIERFENKAVQAVSA